MDLFSDIVMPLLRFLFLFMLFYVVASYGIRAYRDFGMVYYKTCHSFDGLQFSTLEFYTLVSAALDKRQIDGLSIDKKEYWQTSVFSTRRDYLRISRGDQMILVCAAPFGNSFFVSLWAGETLNFFKELLPRIPYGGKRLANFIFSKTYFEQDTDAMFKNMVEKCVQEAIDHMTEGKGVRAISELATFGSFSEVAPA
jgi:hypothetical protein